MLRILFGANYAMTRALLLLDLDDRRYEKLHLELSRRGIVSINFLSYLSLFRATRYRLPDIAVICLERTDVYGIDAARNVLQANPEIRIIIAASEYSAAVAHDCLWVGCKGLIKAPIRPNSLASAIETVAAGGLHYSAEHIQAAALIRAGVAPELALTNRDGMIMKLRRNRLTPKEIALRLRTTEMDIMEAEKRLCLKFPLLRSGKK